MRWFPRSSVVAVLVLASAACADSAPSQSNPASARAGEPEFVLEQPASRPRGSVLLVHGSAPFNLDGRIPLAALDSPYAREPFFRDLAAGLKDAGFRVLRYSKPGVHLNRVDALEYAQTDVARLGTQLKALWDQLPTPGPRVVLAWSEGTLHVRMLPLPALDGVILLGAISTNIADVVVAQGGPPREVLRNQVMTLERTAMLGADRPAGRLLDELDLDDNWRWLSARPELPVLVLHGAADREVPVQQAHVWKQQLPGHRITVEVGDGLDHRFMTPGRYEPARTVSAVVSWLDRTFPRP